MFGDDILFAPIMEQGKTARNVYLPEGEWVLAKDGTEYTGGTYEIHAQIDEFIAFVRKGASVLDCFRTE